jgi:hypothetical protein
MGFDLDTLHEYHTERGKNSCGGKPDRPVPGHRVKARPNTCKATFFNGESNSQIVKSSWTNGPPVPREFQSGQQMVQFQKINQVSGFAEPGSPGLFF